MSRQQLVRIYSCIHHFQTKSIRSQLWKKVHGSPEYHRCAVFALRVMIHDEKWSLLDKQEVENRNRWIEEATGRYRNYPIKVSPIICTFNFALPRPGKTTGSAINCNTSILRLSSVEVYKMKGIAGMPVAPIQSVSRIVRSTRFNANLVLPGASNLT